MLQIGQPVTIGHYWAKHCGGDSFSSGRIEAVGYDWVVIRMEDGDLSMGRLDSSDPVQQIQQISS